MVDEKWCRKGIGGRIVEESFASVGAERMDLIASDESPSLYRSFKHRGRVEFRIYPGKKEEG